MNAFTPIFQIHPYLWPTPQPPERKTEAVRLEMVTKQLERVHRALMEGLHTKGSRGKPKRLSSRDRDAVLLAEIDKVLTEIR